MSEVSPTVSSCNSHIKSNPKFSSVKHNSSWCQCYSWSSGLRGAGAAPLPQLCICSTSTFSRCGPVLSTVTTTSWWLSPVCWYLFLKHLGCTFTNNLTWALSRDSDFGTWWQTSPSMNPLSTGVTTAAELQLHHGFSWPLMWCQSVLLFLTSVPLQNQYLKHKFGCQHEIQPYPSGLYFLSAGLRRISILL